jgi:glycosyltransferase involved in cell wall biosynthesis
MPVADVLAVLGPAESGSGALHLLDLLRGLQAKGARIVLACEELPPEARGREIGFPCLLWREAGRQAKAAWSEVASKVFPRGRAGLVHVWGGRLERHGRRLLRQVDAPVVLTPGFGGDGLSRAGRLRRRCDHMIALNQSMREALVNRAGVPRERVSVVAPGIDIHAYGSVAHPFGDAPRGHTPVVGMSAAFEAGQGHDVFLQAARHVLDSGMRVEFLVGGEGPLEEALRAKADALGLLERVTFATRGWGGGGVLRAADIFVRPASVAGIGTSLLVAMAMAKPVVACATAGIVEIVDDWVTGLLVPKNEPEALADAIHCILAAPTDARAMGLAGQRRVAEHFGLDQFVERTLKIYDSVVKAARGAR